MSYKLEKSYTDIERADFIVEYNHKLGLHIEETEQALYALEANEMMAWVDVDEEIRVEVEPAVYKTVEVPAKYETIQQPVYNEEGFPILDEDGNQVLEEVQIEIEPARTEEMLVKEAVYETQTVTVKRYIPVINPNYEEEYTKAERKRLDNLSMTRGDVFEALILAKGLGKSQLRQMIEQAELDEVTKALYLNRFDEALEFYRGYPIFDMVGQVIGVTGKQLDKFFDNKDYKYLTTCNLTINATPTKATVIGAGAYPYGATVNYRVEAEGHIAKEGSIELLKDEVIEVVLDEDTTNTTTDVQNEVGE